ncbi:hypothetical protein WJX81_000854 [Elliptochloris bilobata]|uniref:N-acetyltransferase domain-containing protein n=1 Tax=Elliptochloris bilobata TaxID=381761 RepID=A0AAW1QMN3_9CHLO
MQHTFAVVAAYAAEPGESSAPGQLVGLARAVSDGAFAASVVDVAVLPLFQRRRIGRELVQRLMFFFRAGFRLTRKYCFMRFDAELLDDDSRMDLEQWGRSRVLGSLRGGP